MSVCVRACVCANVQTVACDVVAERVRDLYCDCDVIVVIAPAAVAATSCLAGRAILWLGLASERRQHAGAAVEVRAQPAILQRQRGPGNMPGHRRRHWMDDGIDCDVVL